jgi:hypothetical protein
MVCGSAASWIISNIINNKDGLHNRVTMKVPLYPVKRQLRDEVNLQYWEEKMKSQQWHIWSGYSFESVCMKHLDQIKKALFIPAGTLAGSWSYIPMN